MNIGADLNTLQVNGVFEVDTTAYRKISLTCWWFICLRLSIHFEKRGAILIGNVLKQ